MNWIIVDLDGCIADDSRRIPLLPEWRGGRGKTWDEYHADLINDPPFGSIIELVASRAKIESASVAIVTARPEKYRTETQIWMLENLIRFSHLGITVKLHMRPNGDESSSVEYKRAKLREILIEDCGDQGRVIEAYDDMRDICVMYSEEGVQSFRTAFGSIAEEFLSINADELAAEEEFQRVYFGPEPQRKSVEDILDEAAATFRERNAIYGDNFDDFGHLLSALFPRGLTIAPGDSDAFNRLAVFLNLLNKVSRYARQFHEGGHLDSARDAINYSAILQRVTK